MTCNLANEFRRCMQLLCTWKMCSQKSEMGWEMEPRRNRRTCNRTLAYNFRGKKLFVSWTETFYRLNLTLNFLLIATSSWHRSRAVNLSQKKTLNELQSTLIHMLNAMPLFVKSFDLVKHMLLTRTRPCACRDLLLCFISQKTKNKNKTEQFDENYNH